MSTAGAVLGSLVEAVAEAYDLGAVEQWAPVHAQRTANHVLQVHAAHGDFAVKVFRYTVDDSRWLAALRRGGEFESAVRAAGWLAMPEPVRDRRGDLFAVLPGPVEPCLIRVHRWLDGSVLQPEEIVAQAAAAGETLGQVQETGRRFGRASEGALLWWRWDPQAALQRLAVAGAVTLEAFEEGRETLTEALALVEAAERDAGEWVYCHYDVKPANCLLTSKGLAILDWDEAAMCPPELEAVESALLWAGHDDGDCAPEIFTAFLDGYRGAGGRLGGLQQTDFGKFVASAVGWFDYLARHRFGEFPDTAAGQSRPDPGAVLTDLRYRLETIDVWRSWA